MNSAQFTGRENDGTGLYYLRARYYSPALQRFISQDPIGFVGGINLYAYAGDNPIGLIDLLGTDPSGQGGGSSVRKPSPYLGYGADALSAIGAATHNGLLGALGTATSLWNDPSSINVLMTLSGIAEPMGEAIAAINVAQDVGMGTGNFITNKILAPVFDAAPPQLIDDGNGHLIPNPAKTSDCQAAGWCS